MTSKHAVTHRSPYRVWFLVLATMLGCGKEKRAVDVIPEPGWEALGSGTDSTVSTLAVWRSQLVAGGRFTQAGDSAAAKVACFRDGNWELLDNTPDPGGVMSMTVFQSALFVVANSGTAWRWDGSSWTAPISFAHHVIGASERLYLSADMTGPVGQPFSWVGSWDGSTLTGLGTPMPYIGRVTALGFYQDTLIAGTYGGLLKWNTTEWDSLPADIECDIDRLPLALCEYAGKLVVGGSFDVAGGISCHRIASWDGRSWAALGTGCDNAVLALTTYRGKLIAGGKFTTAGGRPCSHVASWNGTTWEPLGSGVDGTVTSLVVFDDTLVAGGEFGSAGGVVARHVARWRD